MTPSSAPDGDGEDRGASATITPTQDAPGLRACPFCGGEAKLTKGYWKEGGWHPPKIMCENFHTFRCNSEYQAKDSSAEEAKAELTAAWNDRPNAYPELVAALEGLVKAVNTDELAAAMACHHVASFANVEDALTPAIAALRKAGVL